MNKLKRTILLVLCSVLMLTTYGTGLMASSASDLIAPYYITNSYGADASTEFIVQWHNTIEEQLLQITEATDTNFQNAREITSADEGFTVRSFELDEEYVNGRGLFPKRNIFRVEIKGLKPQTDYIYRMGKVGAWSETFSVSTADKGNNFSFTIVSDPQSNAHTDMGVTLRKAEEFDADNRFIINCGDITDQIGRDNTDGIKEIESYTIASNEFNKTKPIMATQGNHDTYYYVGTEGDNQYNFGEATVYNAYVTNPFNGVAAELNEGLTKSQSYYFYYNNVLFVMVNTLVTDAQHAVQKVWLQKLLQYNQDNNLSQYIIVGMHIGPFGNRYFDQWKEALIRQTYAKLMSDYKVDGVYYGHDHTYARSNAMVVGSNTSISNSATISGSDMDFGHYPETGTYYSIVGATGPKFYDATNAATAKYFPIRTTAQAEQEGGVFVNFKVTSEKITVTAKTILGTELDSYEILPKRDAQAPVEVVETTANAIELKSYELANVKSIEVTTVSGRGLGEFDLTSGVCRITGLKSNSVYNARITYKYNNNTSKSYITRLSTEGFLEKWTTDSVAITKAYSGVEGYRVFVNGDLVWQNDIEVRQFVVPSMVEGGSYLVRVELLSDTNEVLETDHIYFEC